MPPANDQAVAPQSGLIFWVTPQNRRVTWLRYVPLLLLVAFLATLSSYFSGGYAPDAPAQALMQASLVVIIMRGWMLLVDLVYRLPSREPRYLTSYLIAFGLTVLLAFLLRFIALLLDDWFSPTGHFFALQGVFAVLLTLAVAPITLGILHQEPLSYYWLLVRRGEADWPGIETDLRRVLARRPGALRPTLLLVEALLRQDQRDEARGLLKYLITIHPYAWGGWAALGALALEDEDWDRAAAALERAHRRAPRSAHGSLRLGIGLALLGMGRLDEGYQEIDQARGRSLPPHLRHFLWFMLMRIGQVAKDPGLMLQANRAVKEHPKDARAFLAWYETLDRSHSPTLAEDLHEAADWTRHLLGIRRVIT